MKKKSAAALAAVIFASLALMLPVNVVSAEEEPAYEPETSYEETYEEPSYEEEPSYDEEPSYYEEPSYDEEPSYYEEPSYDEEPGYHEESSYYEESYEEPSYEESYEESYYYEESYEEPSYYEPDSQETEFFEQSETQEPSINESAAESSMENSLLTSEDWENMQKSMNSTAGTTSNAASRSQDFAEIKDHKDDGTSKNNTWIYLALGLPLILVGAGLIAGVIIFNIKASRSTAAAENTAAPADTSPVQPSQPIEEFLENDDTGDDEVVFSTDAFFAAKTARQSGDAADSDKFDTVEDPANTDNNNI